MSDLNGHFGADYADCRGRFLGAVADVGKSTAEYINPNAQTPSGGPLITDVVRFGSEDASRVLFSVSGTHGAEGFCGSGCQTAMLRGGEFGLLPDNTALVLIHAINPFGFSWLTRTTEDNIDLNRNFVDHGGPAHENPAYDAVHPLVTPVDWDGAARMLAEEGIAAFIAERGLKAWQAAVTGGQYTHPDGICYGGDKPGWSNLTFREILREHGRGAEHAALIDIHTGLGPYGYGEPIMTGHPRGKARAQGWYGEDVTDPFEGNSSTAPIHGFLTNAVEEELPDALVTGMALEFGTLPLTEVELALRADNWLRSCGGPDHPLAQAIRRQRRDASYPDFDDWRAMVVARNTELTHLAIRGLADA